MTAIARTPLHHWHTQHGGRLVERHGWHVPISYTTVEQELAAARSGVGLADLSAIRGNLHEKYGVVGADMPSAYAAFGLIGPRAEDVLRQVCSLDVSERGLPVDRHVETNVAGVHAVLIRTAEGAIPVIRIHVAWDLGEYVWESLLAAGGRWQITAIGVEAWHSPAMS